MKIIEIMIRSFYVIAGGNGIHKLDAAITGTSIILLCNIVAIYNWIIGNIAKLMGIHIYPNKGSISTTSMYCALIVYGISIGIIGFILLRKLGTKYLNKAGYYHIMKMSIPTVVAILILIVSYLGTIFFMFYSYSFWVWYD